MSEGFSITRSLSYHLLKFAVRINMTPVFILLTSFVVAEAVLSADYNCPDRCQCRPTPEQKHRLVVRCSNLDLQQIPRAIDPATAYLDLSGNQIQVVPRGVFDGLPHLSILLLNNNQIRKIDAHAFRELNNIKKLDLSSNKLTELASDALSRIQGSQACSARTPCSINLQGNPLALVDSYALSWCKRLSLIFGNSSTDLVIKAYAFYGAEDLTEILISGVPSLYLEHRIFTNTDQVKLVEISNTALKTIEKFTFEGLTNVHEIRFHHVHFSKIDEFGFSGIFYPPSEISQLTSYSGVHQRAGGLFNISHSVIPVLPPDGFRDTNLKVLTFDMNDIYRIRGHAFRGIHSLFSLDLTDNAIGAIDPYAFGALKNVPRVSLVRNKLSQFVQRAFAESKGIRELNVHANRHANTSLGSYSFSGLRDVEMLDIRGAPGSTFVVERDAFHDLGGVNTLRIAHVSLPTLTEHTFRGLNKVGLLRLEYCNISRVEGLAFGGSPGAVAVIELNEGNKLSCDCDTSKLLRNFQNKFARFVVTCTADDSVVRVLREDSSDWPSCDTAAAICVQHVWWWWLFVLSYLLCSYQWWE